MKLYRALRGLLRFATTVFFRRIEVVGLEHVPHDGPVVFCGNHPNSLLDPVMITAWCGRIVHFAAKDVLFQSAVLRFFLVRMGAVPIQRRKDHGDGQLSNDAAFDRLFDVLAAGRTMGIFPEGISHEAAQLSRLKTGAARIALGAAARHPELAVKVVPCGLHYVHRRRFRSSVLVQFGPPIEIDDAWRRAQADDARAAARSLTGEIDAGMRALTVNADSWDTLRVLDGVRRLYQPPRISLEQRVELARRFATAYPTVKDEPDVVTLYARVQAYVDRLESLGLRDADVMRDIDKREVVWRVARHLLLMVLWVPLAVVGLPIHLPLGLIIRYGSWRFAPRKDVVATTKFLVGLLIMLGLYVAIGVGSGLLWGWPWGLTIGLLVPASGYATIRVLERTRAIQRLFAVFGALLALPRAHTALRMERAQLAKAVQAAVNAHLPEGMERLFPEAEAP